MIELAHLAELASPMFHVVLTSRFIRSDWEHGLRRIDWSLHTSSALHVCRVVVFTRGPIFTSSCSEIVSTVFFCLGWSYTLRIRRWGRHFVSKEYFWVDQKSHNQTRYPWNKESQSSCSNFLAFLPSFALNQPQIRLFVPYQKRSKKCLYFSQNSGNIPILQKFCSMHCGESLSMLAAGCHSLWFVYRYDKFECTY